MSATRRLAVIATVGGLLTLAACAGSSGEEGAASSSTSPVASAASVASDATTTTAAPTTTSAPVGTSTTPTTAGRVQRDQPVRFSFQPPGSWIGADAPGAFGYDDNTIQIVIAKPTWYADFSAMDAVKPLAQPPTDLYAWLNAPGLPKVSPPEPVTIGGVTTVRVLQDPWVAAPWRWAGQTLVNLPDCGCLVMFGIATDFWAAETSVATWYVPVSVQGTDLVIAVTGSPSSKPPSADEIWRRAEPILATITWD